MNKTFLSLALVAFAFVGTTAENIKTPTNLSTTQSPYIDLTEAAESTVNSVVYIKVSMASKQIERYSSPFDDFF